MVISINKSYINRLKNIINASPLTDRQIIQQRITLRVEEFFFRYLMIKKQTSMIDSYHYQTLVITISVFYTYFWHINLSYHGFEPLYLTNFGSDIDHWIYTFQKLQVWAHNHSRWPFRCRSHALTPRKGPNMTFSSARDC